MGAPSSKPQENVANQQQQIASQQQQQSAEDRSQSKALQQPAIDFNKAIAGGDKESLLSSLGPILANITQGKSAAKGSIMDGVAPGAARDIALAETDRGTSGAIAATKNSAYTGSFDKLANIGSGLGSFSLSETGAALSGLQGAASTYGAVAAQKEQAKSATLGALGSLGGAAGTAFAGRKG